PERRPRGRRRARTARAAAHRLLPDVLRRHRALRGLARDGERARLLRRRSRAVRHGFSLRSREGTRVHPRYHRGHGADTSQRRGQSEDLRRERASSPPAEAWLSIQIALAGDRVPRQRRLAEAGVGEYISFGGFETGLAAYRPGGSREDPRCPTTSSTASVAR